MNFRVITPFGTTYEDTIDKATIPTKAGAITILEKHAPLVSVLDSGEMIIHKGSATVPLAISGGILEITPDGDVFVLADTAERAEQIDMQRAEQARMRAAELLKQQKNVDNIDFARLQAQMEKELTRISVGKKYRKLR
jgi:F-type H+-transporting ATPase subunit epsilon